MIGPYNSVYILKDMALNVKVKHYEHEVNPDSPKRVSYYIAECVELPLIMHGNTKEEAESNMWKAIYTYADARRPNSKLVWTMDIQFSYLE